MSLKSRWYATQVRFFLSTHRANNALERLASVDMSRESCFSDDGRPEYTRYVVPRGGLSKAMGGSMREPFFVGTPNGGMKVMVSACDTTADLSLLGCPVEVAAAELGSFCEGPLAAAVGISSSP